VLVFSLIGETSAQVRVKGLWWGKWGQMRLEGLTEFTESTHQSDLRSMSFKFGEIFLGADGFIGTEPDTVGTSGGRVGIST